MEVQIFSLLFNITLFLTIKVTYSSVDISSAIPVYRIMLTSDINNLDIKPYLNWEIGSKGYGIVFNKTSEKSYVPIALFERIQIFYQIYDEILQQTHKYKNGIRELIVYANLERGYEDIHFALEFIGISIPLEYLFVEKEDNSEYKLKDRKKYGLRFLTRENQEYIVFGRDMIELMDVELINENDFIIHNTNFITKVDN
jgi:hypothetical protein